MIDTHVNADHVKSSCILRDATEAKSTFGDNSVVQCANILLCEGDELEFVRFKLKAISTPGHADA